MEKLLEFLKSDIFLYVVAAGFILLLILYIINCIKLSKLRKGYANFMKKLGNGKNLEEMLKNYVEKVEEVYQKNIELDAFCKKLDSDMAGCLQKVGIVRYSAFKDMGSDLSFALAILDEKNNGVVLNGIYSREISNIYAKPITEGKSNYTISQEEQKAIDMAIDSEGTFRVRD